jgi:hypothetical protein
MTTTLKHLALVIGLAVLAGGGCGSSDQPAGAATATPDGGASSDGAALVPLVVWVDDLMTWEATRAPDTVEDKHVMDTEDPGAFDMLLAQPQP